MFKFLFGAAVGWSIARTLARQPILPNLDRFLQQNGLVNTGIDTVTGQPAYAVGQNLPPQPPLGYRPN